MAYDPLPDSVFEYSLACSSGTLSTGTINVPGFTQQTFKKYRDDTNILMIVRGSAWANSISTTCRWGIALAGTDYMGRGLHYFNTTGSHRYWKSTNTITGIAIGSHTVMGRWQYISGGTMSCDSNDLFSVILREVTPNGI